METLRANTPLDDLLEVLLSQGALWTASEGELIMGFVVYRSQMVEAVYVDPLFRRQGVARTLVSSLRELTAPPLDAFALPGDRAMKSLYESFGWKARLLTMHAE